MKSVIQVEEKTLTITVTTETGQTFLCETFFDAEALRLVLERVEEKEDRI